MKNIDSLKIASKLLKSQRESLRLSIKEVSVELRLEERIIRDIEEGNFIGFKSYLFLKGYLINYAKLVGANISLPGVENKNKTTTATATATATATVTETATATKNNNTDISRDKIAKLGKHKKKNLLIIFSIILVILVIYKIQSSSYSISKVNNTDDLESIAALPLKNTKESVPLVEKKLLNDNVKINTKEAGTQNIVLSKVLEGGQADDEEFAIDSNSVPSKNKSIVQYNNTNITDNDPKIVAVGKKLEIFYNGDSWTEIIDSYGNIVFFDLVKQGKTLEFNILAPFEILIGNATVVDIQYSNKKISIGYINPSNNVGKIKIKE